MPHDVESARIRPPGGPRRPRRAAVWAASAFGACATLLTALLVTVGAGSAAAHGTVSDPPARHHACYFNWPNGPTAQMAAEDPMCHRAWQADPSAMYNWNGLLRDGVGGDHQAAVPDGQLCSGGLTFDGRYAAFDQPGAWRTVNRPSRFTLNIYDQSSHGSDYIRVYSTRQGFDPKTQQLRWSDLDLVGQAGKMPTGTRTPVEVNAPGRTGHHIVFTVWKASHGDQNYYACSDVNFTDGGTDPTTTTPTTPTTTTDPSTTVPTTTTTNPATACSATYRVVSQWAGGFQAEVRVTAGTAATRGWTVDWAFGNGERVSSSWSAVVTSSGSAVSARNAAYNGALAAGAATTFGFVGSGTAATAPTLSCAAS